MPRPAALLPVLTIAAALVASTAVAGAADAAASHPARPATKHGRSAVNFHTRGSRGVVAPATTAPGIAHLRNTGTGLVGLVEAKHPNRSSTRQVAKAFEANSAEPLLHNYRLITLALPGSGSYSRLTRGTYYLANLDRPHLRASKIATMTVTGPRVDARVPKSRGLVVTSHHHLRLPGSISRSGYLHVQNHSSALAEFLFVGVDDQTTRAMLDALVAHPSFSKLFGVVDLTSNAFLFAPIVATGPHSASWVRYHGTPGRYVAAVLTVTGTKSPRLHRGQVRVLNLT